MCAYQEKSQSNAKPLTVMQHKSRNFETSNMFPPENERMSPEEGPV